MGKFLHNVAHIEAAGNGKILIKIILCSTIFGQWENVYKRLMTVWSSPFGTGRERAIIRFSISLFRIRANEIN